MATVSSTLAPHDPPPVANGRLWAGVVLAPAAWSVAELVGYFLVARACDRGAGNAGGPAAVMQAVLVVALVVVGIVGLAIAVSNWRRLGEPRETRGPASPAVWGRAQFMALGGVIASSLFVLGMVLFALGPLLGNGCNEVR